MKDWKRSGLIWLTITILFLYSYQISAQVSLTTYTDIGRQEIFRSVYTSCYVAPGLYVGKLRVEPGLQWTFANDKKKKFDGGSFSVNYSYKLLRKPITTRAVIIRRETGMVQSTCLGLIFNMATDHWDFSLGNNYRRYRLGQDAFLSDISGTPGTYITEPLNLLYSLTYNINISDRSWNIGFTLTDYDNLVIEQETTPIFIINTSHAINDSLMPFFMAGYKTAGMLNLSVNYFGYYFRIGLLWKLKE